MDKLREMFGGRSERELQDALNKANNDPDVAVYILLDTPSPELRQRSGNELNQAPLTPASSSAASSSAASSSAASFEQLRISLDEEKRSAKPNVQTPPLESDQPHVPAADKVVTNILNIFPDACTQFIKKIYHNNYLLQGHNIVEFIANSFAEDGYDRVERVGHKRKRKVEEEEKGKDYESLERPMGSGEYYTLARRLLEQEFPFIPANFIERTLAVNRRLLVFAYPVLTQAEKGLESGKGIMYKRLKSRRKINDDDHSKMGKVWTELLEELDHVRSRVKETEANAQLQEDAKLAAQINEKEHEDTNNIIECNCCFGEYTFEKMTHCIEVHFFCMDCARRNAEAEIGNGRHKLKCMDGSGCQAEFSQSQVSRFLSETSQMAIGRLEQEEALRVAEIDGLVKCPFCDYAAICESIEVDKEFRCANSDCLEVSCRHCERRSHLPKTCEEVAKEDKIDHRHAVEEAMTEAMIRKCNKCKSPFIKESGCNKMMCNKPGCRNQQCYVCSKDVKGYSHFNDTSRGGEAGNCLLFDNVEERHDQEIQEAAKVAMAKAKEQNPDLTEDDLEIQFSDEVKRLEAQRKRNANPRGGYVPLAGPIPQYVPGQPGAPPMGVRQENAAVVPPILGIIRRRPPPQIQQPPPPINAQFQRPIQRVVNMIRARNQPQMAPIQSPLRRHRQSIPLARPPVPYVPAPPHLPAEAIGGPPIAFRGPIDIPPPPHNRGTNVQYIQNNKPRRQ